MTNGYGLSDLDYWKLADEFSVVDAAFLILLSDPGHYSFETRGDPSSSRIFQIANWTEDQFDRMQTDDGHFAIDPAKFRAVFKALRNAILANKLKARITNWARHPDHQFYGDDFIPEQPDPEEETRNYGFALSRGVPTVYSNADSIESFACRPEELRVLYILKEPDWFNSTIQLDDLKTWFASRGVAPPFFFPEGLPDGFRDQDHRRYSAKLATAIAAWEAVDRPSKGKSVKKSLCDWVVSNGIRFGRGNAEGVVSQTAAEEIAKIANWQTSGGATPTYIEADEDTPVKPEKIENFEKIEQKVRNLDDEIPF